jgi:chorismate mutase/prephenate dehydratase
MTKKKVSRAQAPLVRKEIERIDRDLAKVIAERAKASERLAKARLADGLPVFDPAEEDAAQQKFIEHHKGPLTEPAARLLYRGLVSAAQSAVKKTRVAYLGPQYSYSHLAAIEKFGVNAELIAVASIRAVFEELSSKQSEYGVVPIENSTDGRIVDTLDMFARMPIRICGDVQIRIHHNLIGRCPRSEITEVYSKPQAISQCREWLQRHLPGVRTVEMTSTAIAAQIAVDKPGAAAIASLQAAMHYGLSVIDGNIEDNKHNATRFAVLGGSPTKRTGKDKTSLMFEIPHKPGSLADALLVFKKNRMNMTWIESFPMPGTKPEYLFFVEFEGHAEEPRIARALDLIRRRCVRLEVLGSYPRSEPVD